MLELENHLSFDNFKKNPAVNNEFLSNPEEGKVMMNVYLVTRTINSKYIFDSRPLSARAKLATGRTISVLRRRLNGIAGLRRRKLSTTLIMISIWSKSRIWL